MDVRIFYRQDDEKGQHIVEMIFHNVIKIDCFKEDQVTQEEVKSITIAPEIQS